MVRYLKINRTIGQKITETVKPSSHLSGIDENDRKILKILLFNPRLSYREIAKATKLSVGTVSERIRKLMASGVLRGFHADVDAKKLGYTLTAVIEVIATKGEFLEAAEEISKYSNVYGVYAVSGPYDAMVIAKFKDADELNDFLKKMNKRPDVIRTETHVVLKTMKEDFRVKI